MDNKEFRILTIMTIVKQLYRAQSKELSRIEKVYNVRNIISKEKLFIDLNLTNQQLDNMILNIINPKITNKPKTRIRNRNKRSTHIPKKHEIKGIIQSSIKKQGKTKTKTRTKTKTKTKTKTTYDTVVKTNINLPVRTIEIRQKQINYVSDSIDINVLIDNMIRDDNEYNRDMLKNTILYRLNKGSYEQLNTIYNIFYKSIKNNDISLLNIMVDADIDINAQDEEGNTGLHYAVYFKRTNAIMILLQNEANINLRNKHGYKPMDLISNSLLYNIKGGSKQDMKDLLNYRKKKTFKINTSVSLFGNHINLVNINNESELSKINKHKGILVFYMIKCGWCKKMQEDIKILCQRGIKVYAMESAQLTTNIRKKYDINGFPTIYILKDGKHRKYSGNRSYRDFENALK